MKRTQNPQHPLFISVFLPYLLLACFTPFWIFYISSKSQKPVGQNEYSLWRERVGGEMKQTNFEPSFVAGGREENRAGEAGKGLEKARDVHTPMKLTPSQF